MQDFKRYLSTKTSAAKQSRQAYNFCFCFSRMFRLKMAEPPEDIVNLFNRYSDGGVMTVEQFHKFLVEFQEESSTTIDDAQNIFDGLKLLNVFPRRGLHLNVFFKYLFGDLNSPICLEVYHRMDAPLAHYFLYTGHNSYLTGNQICSHSSIEPIITALKNSVRVIELDLWPKDADDVIVTHGGTLTSSVELIKCLEAIRENAFYASEYPVIITFEDHLRNPSLQKKVAEMVSSTFGEMLHPGMDFLKFPSPESLKRKILISTKPPQESLDSLPEHEHEHDDLLKENFTNVTVPILDDAAGSSRHVADTQAKVNREIEEGEDGDVVSEYRNLIAIHARKIKGDLRDMLKDNSKGVGRLSISEQRLQHAVKTYAPDIVRFTQTNLLRVYPKGTRISSSNYNPLTGWNHGAQMVAFNMQGYGKELSIMQGLFRANGGCGYVKKPDILLSNEPFDPNFKRDVEKILKVKLYMGDGWHLDFRQSYFDRLSPPDFFTKLQIVGVTDDKAEKKTRTIEDQWVPIWNQEFEFPLRVPDLALLRIKVLEYDTTGKPDFAGQTCLPVSEIRPGIRAVPLYNKKGVIYPHVKLLMRFQFVTPVDRKA